MLQQPIDQDILSPGEQRLHPATFIEAKNINNMFVVRQDEEDEFEDTLSSSILSSNKNSINSDEEIQVHQTGEDLKFGISIIPTDKEQMNNSLKNLNTKKRKTNVIMC